MMLINKESNFLTGKIKFWKKPIFDLDKFRELDEELRIYMSEKLNLTFNPFFIQPPRNNSILGNKKETYRFDFVQIDDKTDFIDHIEIGYGEHGYYYDIYLSSFELTPEKWDLNTNRIQNFIQNLEKNIERELEELYLLKNLLNENEREKSISISNFSVVIESDDWENTKFQTISTFFNCLTTIDLETESFFFDDRYKSNIIIPEYSFKIFPKKMFDNPGLTQKSGKHFNLERSFKIIPLDIDKKMWEIQSRGILFSSMALLVKKLIF